MLKTSDIINNIKIELQKESDKKVYDKDVAEAIGITSTNFGSMKNRSKIPFKEICIWCHDKGLKINDILFKKSLS